MQEGPRSPARTSHVISFFNRSLKCSLHDLITFGMVTSSYKYATNTCGPVLSYFMAFPVASVTRVCTIISLEAVIESVLGPFAFGSSFTLPFVLFLLNHFHTFSTRLFGLHWGWASLFFLCNFLLQLLFLSSYNLTSSLARSLISAPRAPSLLIYPRFSHSLVLEMTVAALGHVRNFI